VSLSDLSLSRLVPLFFPSQLGAPLARARECQGQPPCNKSKINKKQKIERKEALFFEVPRRAVTSLVLVLSLSNSPLLSHSPRLFVGLQAHQRLPTMLSRAPACSSGAQTHATRRRGPANPPRSKVTTTTTTLRRMPHVEHRQHHQALRRSPVALAPRASLDDPTASSSPSLGGEEGASEGGGVGGGCPVLPFRSSSNSSSSTSSTSSLTSSSTSSSPVSSDLPLPPGSFGLPVLGENWQMLKSPSKFHRQRREKHGESSFFEVCFSSSSSNSLFFCSFAPKKKTTQNLDLFLLPSLLPFPSPKKNKATSTSPRSSGGPSSSSMTPKSARDY